MLGKDFIRGIFRSLYYFPICFKYPVFFLSSSDCMADLFSIYQDCLLIDYTIMFI